MTNNSKEEIVIATLYKFIEINDLDALQEKILSICVKNKVKGTILLAPEGINGTISAKKDEIENVLKYLEDDKRFNKLDVKFSSFNEQPFNRMKVRLKKEIVTIGDPEVNPAKVCGDYIEPEDWNELIKDPNVIVIDTRNRYETEIGKFKNAVDPKTNSFREFPDWVDNFKKEIEDPNKKIAMYCTGGIRCEKSTSLLKKRGFKNVYHLKGGILKYLETVPKKESLWDGECFVFDDRVALDHDLGIGSYQMCYACRMPLTENDLTKEQYEEGISCHHCYKKTTKSRKERFSSRQKQIELAKSRGVEHFGPQHRK